jgi:hypothetical protein
MLFILRWLKRLWYRPVAIPPQVARPSVEPPSPVVAPVKLEDSPVIPPIAGPTVEISANRHERRKLERARRKYDKFVTPQGALIEKPKRKTQEVKPRLKKVEVIGPNDPFDDPCSNEVLIVDSHHENRSDTVAYREAELQGEFNFRDTILQQLERYFVYLERMKKHDADSYGFYKEVGATLLPYMATGAWNREGTVDKPKEAAKHNTPLADWFHKTRPTFGCFAYGADPETERYEIAASGRKRKGDTLWVPKFLYFTKYKQPPPEIQLISGGDIYKMTVWWDRTDNKKMKHGYPQEFPIFVSADGKEVIALRCCDTKHIPIRTKVNGAGHRRGKMFSIPKRAWHIPGEFEEWAKENGDTAQHYLAEVFKDAIYRNEMSQYSMTRITATKGDVAAVFSVNIHRTAYFFQDRDIHLNAEGSRKRIFHFVRPHVRADGTTVKAHFRGENEFDWAGYHIKITIPGRDHFPLGEFNVGSSDDYWRDPKDKSEYLHMPELGKRLKGWMDEGRGKHA